MGIENIIGKIAEDKELKKSALLEEAGRKCRDILSSAEKKAKETKDEILLKNQKTVQDERNRRITLAALEIKKNILEEKQKILSNVYEKILKKISELPENDIKKFLKKIVQNQPINDPKESTPTEIIVSQQYKDVFPVLSQKNISIRFEKIREVFIIKKAGTETRFSFESVIETLKENTEIKIAEILF